MKSKIISVIYKHIDYAFTKSLTRNSQWYFLYSINRHVRVLYLNSKTTASSWDSFTSIPPAWSRKFTLSPQKFLFSTPIYLVAPSLMSSSSALGLNSVPSLINLINSTLFLLINSLDTYSISSPASLSCIISLSSSLLQSLKLFFHLSSSKPPTNWLPHLLSLSSSLSSSYSVVQQVSPAHLNTLLLAIFSCIYNISSFQTPQPVIPSPSLLSTISSLYNSLDLSAELIESFIDTVDSIMILWTLSRIQNTLNTFLSSLHDLFPSSVTVCNEFISFSNALTGNNRSWA